MSNHLAIATVTAGLRQTLSAAVGSAVPGAAVTTSLPDAPAQNQPDPRVNLFLYQVTPNAARRNGDLPARNASGTLVQRTSVALDLHYLLTFYGDETQLEPQRLLGAVVRTLHSQPVLSRPIIQSTITSPTFAFLATSDLGSASEPVRFTPAALALEELSKLWSVFLQTPYRLSIAYQGTVVCIEPDDSPSPALPVRARNLYAVPFRQPVIEQVLSQAARRSTGEGSADSAGLHSGPGRTAAERRQRAGSDCGCRADAHARPDTGSRDSRPAAGESACRRARCPGCSAATDGDTADAASWRGIECDSVRAAPDRHRDRRACIQPDGGRSECFHQRHNGAFTPRSAICSGCSCF